MREHQPKPSPRKMAKILAERFHVKQLKIVCPACMKRNPLKPEKMWVCSFCQWEEPTDRQPPKKKKRRKRK